MSSLAITMGVWMADMTTNAMRVTSHTCFHDRPKAPAANRDAKFP